MIGWPERITFFDPQWAKIEDQYSNRKSRFMADLVRLGLALVGFAVAVVAAGVILGLVGGVLTKRHE